MALRMKVFFYDYSKEYVSGHYVNAKECEDLIENYLKLYGFIEKLRRDQYLSIKLIQCSNDRRYDVEVVAQLLHDEMLRRKLITVAGKRRAVRYAYLEYE